MEQELRAIWKNVIVISVSFMLLFTAFVSMSALQSSINKVDGLGTWSNTSIYASLILSSMFLPSYLIKRLTVKWTMPICMFCYSVYICTQFHPDFFTLIPSGILVGIAAAPLWSAKCTYLSQAAERYAKLTSVDVEPTIAKFFGTFFFFFRCASVFGNLISSLVLKTDKDQNKIHNGYDICGIHFCPNEPLPPDNFSISSAQLYILAGTYLTCSVLAWVFVGVFLDPLTKYQKAPKLDSIINVKEDVSNVSLLLATFNQMKKPYQLCIIPLTVWSGVEKGFFLSDFTTGYISCIFGVGEVGWVLIAYGFSNATCSSFLGFVVEYTGRLPILFFGGVINLTVLAILLTWRAELDKLWAFFLLAGMWGIADAIWNTQLNATYGILFAIDKEAAFSNYRLWESIGFLISFILQTQVCIEVKLYVLVAVIVCGFSGYCLIEINERRNKKTLNITV